MAEQTQNTPKSWPSLLGKQWVDVQAYFTEKHPELQVVRTPENSMITMDFREDRVRIMVDTSGKVAQIPSVG